MKPSELNRHGKIFEHRIDHAFAPLDKKYPMTWERVIDSAAAGNIVGQVESDFRLKVLSDLPGRPYMFVVECKASNQHTSFNKCFRSMIKKGQFPLMRMSVRAGAIGLFFFYSTENKEMEVWDFTQLKKAYYEPRTDFLDQPRYICAGANIEAFAERIVKDPKRFIESVLHYR